MTARLLLTSARITDADADADLSLAVPDHTWWTAPVPGDVHRVLVDAGRLADPDRGDDGNDVGWVDERTWWWHLQVPSPGAVADDERISLVLHGLDTLASVFLDGIEVGRSRDMFLPLELDVTALLRPDRASTLAVRFDPLGDPDRTRLRKAAFSFGWDFAPRRPTTGVWRPVELRRSRRARVVDTGFRTVALHEGFADVVVTVDIASWAADGLALEVDLRGPAGEIVATARVPAHAGRHDVAMRLQEPALWWTHDLGAPVLHELVVQLSDHVGPLEQVRQHVGVRTVRLELGTTQDPDFAFVLNGRRVCVNGANWVPAAVAVGAVPPGRVRALLEAARDAHLTMLRVWAGGVYEDDAFYGWCDRLGLLVWQDFTFVGADPADRDPAFLELVEQEARAQVRRLRSHPSLALWCGNNELALLAELRGVEPAPGARLFEELLPAVVAQEDGATSYLPTSPLPGNGTRGGDKHAWQVWHGLSVDDADRTSPAWAEDAAAPAPGSPEARSFVERAGPDRYLEDDVAFVSEYGLCAAPAYETLVRWIDPAALHLGSRQVQERSRPGRFGPTNKHDLLVHALSGPPTDLRDWTERSQAMQADGLRTGAEHYRRQWPRCSGQLVWQLDDCWPATSWSLLDVDLRPKAGYYALARAFAPVLVSLAPGGRLWLTSQAPVDDVVRVRCRTFDGDLVWERAVEATTSGGSAPLAALPAVPDPRGSYLSWSGERGQVPPSTQVLAPEPQAVRPRATVSASCVLTAGLLEATVTASSFARFVTVSSPTMALRFDDAFVDLEAGAVRVLRAPAPAGIDLSALEVRYR